MKVPEPQKTKYGWRIQLRINGQSIPVTSPDRKTCIKQAARIKAELQAGARMPDIVGVSVEEAISKYIASKENVLSPSTVRAYHIIRKNRWKSIAYRKLKDIKPEEWQSIVSCEAKTCSPKTLRNAWGLLKSAAKAVHIILPEIRLPAKEKTAQKYLRPAQIPVFVEAVKETSFAVPLLLALSSLRISEISALRWEDMSVNARMIHVNGAVVLGADNKYHRKKTNKNLTSTRSFPIFIRELQEAINRDRKPSGPVMTCSQNTIRRNLKRICAEHDLPELTVHGLRHSFASLAYHLQIPEKICMEIGGWADNHTMHTIYTHIAQEDVEHYGSALQQFFDGNQRLESQTNS